eukprot:CAMPEP_0181409468 /NCGR_PEP_ID=MMETSP1110-20121109/6833_1 /TAXON_ID=174948 /ORGANISM="Symbiodinium sp., Strain CCMP421" /LENGTH=610 /DNA_ID=CAMNT_0023531973 /DNA_START=1 /DNA_END=1833 /DNA_ORIENTATION=+
MGAVASSLGCACNKGELCRIIEAGTVEDGLPGVQPVQDEATLPRRIQVRSTTKEYSLDEATQQIVRSEEGPEVAGLALNWLNWLLEQHWPNLKASIEKVIKKDLEPIIQEALPKPLNKLKFKDIDLGEKQPTFDLLKPVFEVQNGFEGLSLEIDIKWNCAGKIDMVFGTVEFSIEQITLEGAMHLKLRPLLEKLPIVGGMQITMLSPPKVQWIFTGGRLALGLQSELVTRTLRKVVADILSDMLVVPNQIFVHWLEGRVLQNDIDLDTLAFPEPEFVMRLCVKSVTGTLDTQSKWSCCASSQMSDAYVMLQLGCFTYQTPAIRHSWQDSFDFLIFTTNQYVNVNVFAQDITYRDVRLGSVEGLTVEHILQRPDGTWRLTRTNDADVADGEEFEVHLTAQFFFLRPSFASVASGKGPANHQAFLFVHLRSCRGMLNDYCSGARIRFCSEGETVLSKGSSYHPMLDDTAIATPTQKMVEHLWETSVHELGEKQTMKSIVEITGLSPEEVSAIVFARPTFTMRWGQFVTVGIKDVEHFSVQISLELEGFRGRAYADLELPLTADDLMATEDWVLDQPLILKPHLENSGDKILHSDVVELNARFKLRCVTLRRE